MPAQWSIALQAFHLAFAWMMVWRFGDRQSLRLIFSLTVYLSAAYAIAGNSSYPVFTMWVLQMCGILGSFLMAQRNGGVAVMICFGCMSVISVMALLGVVPSDLWQGFSFNYWNYMAILYHCCIVCCWIDLKGSPRYAYYVD